jgi:hypothetical protein
VPISTAKVNAAPLILTKAVAVPVTTRVTVTAQPIPVAPLPPAKAVPITRIIVETKKTTKN